MKKQGVVLLLFFFMVMARSEDWRESLGLGKEAVTRLHFYFHDILSGSTPTAVRVAQGAMTNTSTTLFGTVMMADDPLTEGPEPTSKVLGRAQGLYGSAGQDQVSLLMAMSYSFTEGNYNGSSISILGKNPALNPVREMPIVGGTGMFQFARGVAIAKTYWFNASTGDAIVEYNVTVLHYTQQTNGGVFPKNKPGFFVAVSFLIMMMFYL